MWQIAAMKLLVLHAHPRLATSVVQRAMLRAISGLEDVSLVDLYAEYPALDIDVGREQQRLLHHDIVADQILGCGLGHRSDFAKRLGK